jgi:VCBS repeat protein
MIRPALTRRLELSSRAGFAVAAWSALGILASQGVTPSKQQAFTTYVRALQLEATADTSANASVGDVNGDGKLDIVLIKGRHWPGMSRVLLGDGHGRFPIVYDLSDTRYKSYSGTLTDMNGDGAIDVVLSNDRPDPKVILLNDGKGHFHLASTYGDPRWDTRNDAIADLDGDGMPDIVVANRGDKAVQYVCLNQGRGRFDAACNGFADYSVTTITPADVNGDRRVDLIVPSRDGGQSYVYLNDGAAIFPQSKRIPFGPGNASIRMAAAGDFDGDGVLDLIAIDDEHRIAEIYYGIKRGGFGRGERLDTRGAVPYAVAVADLNDDGHPDILVGYIEASSTVFFGDGKKHFVRAAFGDNHGTVYGFAVADLDGDRIRDIVAARSEAPNMLYFGGKPR